MWVTVPLPGGQAVQGQADMVNVPISARVSDHFAPRAAPLPCPNPHADDSHADDGRTDGPGRARQPGHAAPGIGGSKTGPMARTGAEPSP